MDVVISGSSDKPIYQQIFEQISAHIIKGAMQSGESLPPIRTVAKELRISVITVKKAWEELERLGFIYSMVGKGCFVAELTQHELDEKKYFLLDNKMEKDIRYYKELGAKEKEIIDSVKKNYDK